MRNINFIAIHGLLVGRSEACVFGDWTGKTPSIKLLVFRLVMRELQRNFRSREFHLAVLAQQKRQSEAMPSRHRKAGVETTMACLASGRLTAR